MFNFISLYGTAAASALSLAISLFNLYLSWRARMLANEQEKRRAPLLQPILVNSFFKEESEATNYAFMIIMNNPSDSANTIWAADLAISFINSDDFLSTVMIRSSYAQEIDFVRGATNKMQIPIAIPAHGAVNGWLLFSLPRAVREKKTH